MIESFLGFFAAVGAAYLASYYVLIAVIVLGILFEHNDARGSAVFLGWIGLASAYFLFNPTLQELAVGSVAYFFLGVFWSFWRYRQYVIAGVKKSKHHSDLEPKNNTDKIVAWIIIWPLSAIENISSDLIDLISTFVTKTLKGIYSKIYEGAISTKIN